MPFNRHEPWPTAIQRRTKLCSIRGMAAHSPPLETTPSPPSVDVATRWTRRGGPCLVVAVVPSPMHCELPRITGGTIQTGVHVRHLDDLPDGPLLFDTAPKHMVRSWRRLPDKYNRRIERYQYGPGLFKLDWALPIPSHGRSEVAQAATVHGRYIG